MFARDPALTWKYILQIEGACRHSQPNAGHRAIAALERRFEVHVLTQNVDGLHKVAGSSQVIDMHGDVHLLYCTACDWRQVVDDYSHLPAALPPRCPDCRAVIRPDVVLFHEQLPTEKMARLEDQTRQGFDAVFSVGTSSLFSYISRPVWLAARRGGVTVEINPGQTRLSHVVEHRIQAGAADTLTALLEILG
jgi:NAD-dependent deacetylase